MKRRGFHIYEMKGWLICADAWNKMPLQDESSTSILRIGGCSSPRGSKGRSMEWTLLLSIFYKLVPISYKNSFPTLIFSIWISVYFNVKKNNKELFFFSGQKNSQEITFGTFHIKKKYRNSKPFVYIYIRKTQNLWG